MLRNSSQGEEMCKYSMIREMTHKIEDFSNISNNPFKKNKICHKPSMQVPTKKQNPQKIKEIEYIPSWCRGVKIYGIDNYYN